MALIALVAIERFVAATVTSTVGIVEHAIFGKVLVDGAPVTRAASFSPKTSPRRSPCQQGRDALGHDRSPIALCKLSGSSLVLLRQSGKVPREPTLPHRSYRRQGGFLHHDQSLAYQECPRRTCSTNSSPKRLVSGPERSSKRWQILAKNRVDDQFGFRLRPKLPCILASLQIGDGSIPPGTHPSVKELLKDDRLALPLGD